MKLRTISALLLIPSLAATTIAWAQPTGPGPATPPAPAKPAPAGPTMDAAKEQTALKIAGLVVFVANSCPQLKPDYARFKAIIHTLGVTEQQLAQQEMKNRYLSYTTAYQADPKASCDRAGTQFGPQGSTLPDLFTKP